VQSPTEDLAEIEPLQPLEPIQDSGNDQSNIDLDKARQEAFAEGEAKGLAEGRRLAHEELADKQQQFEIDARDEIQSFMASINEDLINHNKLAAPLKRLAVALAEHIARAEVQLSDQSIDNLIERVVGELEPNELQNVVVTVSPGWRNRITENQFDRLFESYEIRTSENLSDGSVRLSTDDRAIEDLIEERITQIASQVFNVKFPSLDKVASAVESPVEENPEQLLEEDTVETDAISDDAIVETATGEQIESLEEPATNIVDEADSSEETTFVMDPPELESSAESPEVTDDED
jgi:flagellar biosynthesis/type III secretory pathway protein FliH